MNPSTFAPGNLVSRDGFGSPVPCLLISTHTLRLNLVLACGIPPEFRGSVHLFIYTAIRYRVSPEFIEMRTMVSLLQFPGSHRDDAREWSFIQNKIETAKFLSYKSHHKKKKIFSCESTAMQSRSSKAKASDVSETVLLLFNSNTGSKHEERFENLKVPLTTFLENGSGFCP